MGRRQLGCIASLILPFSPDWLRVIPSGVLVKIHVGFLGSPGGRLARRDTGEDMAVLKGAEMVARRFSVVVVTLFTVIAGSNLRAQSSPQCITLRIEIPDFPDRTRVIRTVEGRATATLQIKRGDEYPTFYIDLIVRDVAAGLVGVSIRDDRDSDRVLDEFDLQVGGAAARAATTPTFVLAVLQIFERVGVGCRGQ